MVMKSRMKFEGKWLLVVLDMRFSRIYNAFLGSSSNKDSEVKNVRYERMMMIKGEKSVCSVKERMKESGGTK